MSVNIVGRAGELDRLETFVTAKTGQALILRGETGVGKSALVDHAAAVAEREGQRVVHAAGVEAESELPYAGLHQLLYPLLADLGASDDAAWRQLGAVFGRSDGDPPSVMALGVAALSLLTRAADEQQVVLVLDDGQWLDAPSADVCGFVGRRLTGSRVKLLVAVRTDVASRFDTAALPELPVAPLDREDAALLLDQRHPHLGYQARQAVLEQAEGNPLALLELPAHLSGRSDDALPDDVFGQPGAALPRRLQHLYGGRIAALSDAVRAEMLMGALDGVGSRPGDSAGAGLRYRMRDVDEAVEGGLLDVDPVAGDFTIGPLGLHAMVIQPGSFRTGIENRTKASGAAIEDYAATAGAFRAMLGSLTPEMFPGDPQRAAEVIYAEATAPRPRHWVVLGSDAQRRIGAKLDQLRAEFDAGKDIALSTDFPGSADNAVL